MSLCYSACLARLCRSLSPGYGREKQRQRRADAMRASAADKKEEGVTEADCGCLLRVALLLLLLLLPPCPDCNVESLSSLSLDRSSSSSLSSPLAVLAMADPRPKCSFWDTW